MLQKYGYHYRFGTPYKPQTSDQTEITNSALKRVLERSGKSNKKEWYEK